MDYQMLLHTIRSINPTDLAALARITAAFTDLTDPVASDIANNLQKLEKVFHEVHKLSTTPPVPGDPSPQQRYLTRIEKMSENENIIIPAKITPPPLPPNDQPYFQRRDIVWVHFGGVGTELDNDHLAVIWDDNHALEDITVIPTTSKFTMEYAGVFDVGMIQGLPSRNTILSVNLMTRISRKRILHRNGRYVQGILPKPRVERILWGIEANFCNENTLHYYVRNQCDDALPAYLGTFKDMRYMPVRDHRWDAANSVLHYRKWNETAMKSIPMKQPTTPLAGGVTKSLIYDRIFSNDFTKETLGMTDYRSYY